MVKKIIIVTAIFFKAQCGVGQTQAEMNMQAKAAYLKADAAMGVVYKQIQKILSTATEKKLLLDAQRAWIKFKETHCKSVAEGSAGGSIQPLIYFNCLEQLTQQRTVQLNNYLTDDE